MKAKEINKRIQDAVIKEMPDVINRINLNNIEIEPKENKNFNFNLGKYLKLAITSVALVITAFFIYNNFFSPLNNSNTPLESDIEILGFQTITGAILLDGNSVVELSYEEDYQLDDLAFQSTESLQIDDYINDINPFVHLMETIINSENKIAYQEFTSDDINYEFAFRYTSTDLAKNELTYRIYYNDLEDKVSGKIEFSDKTYQFEKNLEQIKMIIDEENYILVDNNSNIDQQKFNYQIYQNNEKVLENDLEIYRVQNNIQVRTKITKNGLSMNLYIQRRYLSNLDELEVEYEIESALKKINGNFKVNLEFDQEANGYRYRYVLGNDEVINQPRRPFSNPGKKNPGGFGTII